MPDKTKQQVGRLAMRGEGDLWNAYYAQPDTMDGAIYLGGVRMKFVADHPERRAAFMDLMREAVADLIQETTGHRPVWGGVRVAPEAERGGHG